MISRYVSDIVFVFIAAIIVFFLADMPEDMKGPVPRPAAESSSVKAPPDVKSVEVGQKSNGMAIGKRNIFASSGNYKDYIQTTIPDNPYILLGIVQEGAGMKALFREYTGTVTKASVGHRMIEGFRVATVSNQQVMLKKENERKAFNVYGASTSPASAQGDVKNLSGRNPLLIGILEGADKKAVFKDHAGNLTILETRQSLPDGSVIAHIDSRSVRLRKGKHEKDLTLYEEAFLKTPVQTVQALPKFKSSKSSAPGRKSYPPNNIVGEMGQGGGK